MKLILASSSPRRQELLREMGIPFEIIEPPLPEPVGTVGHMPPRQQAEALAYFKASSVLSRNPGAGIVLGADTIGVVDGLVMGKPADAEDARRMLRALSDSEHHVITGVAMLHPDGRRLIASDVTHLRMRPMEEGEIEQYIASGEWEGKAGAYAIQETADRFVEQLCGSVTNVVGLPVELVGRMRQAFAPDLETVE